MAVIQEAWIQGVSTRKVDDLVQAMGMSGISKNQMSELCKGIDIRVNSFLERPIERDWTYLWLDATDLKVRENGRIVSVAAMIATGVNTDGRPKLGGCAQVSEEASRAEDRSGRLPRASRMRYDGSRRDTKPAEPTTAGAAPAIVANLHDRDATEPSLSRAMRSVRRLGP